MTLSKTETAILTDAAGREGGLVVLPTGPKQVTAQRALGRLVRDGLLAASEHDGETVHHLTPAGYKAVGVPAPTPAPAVPGPSPKREVVLGLLRSGEGASLAELVAATGWLPHTTRGALSRMRSAGQAIIRGPRQDGSMAYRIAPEPVRRGRRKVARSAADTVAAA